MARRNNDEDGYVSTADRNRAIYGTAIPNVNQRRAYEALQQGAAIENEIRKRGGSIPLDGLNESGQPISTLGMSENDKFFAIGRMNDARRRDEQAQAPILQFEKDINTSVAFGEESNLLNESGRMRAMKAGVKAGLSYQEADEVVQAAFKFLKDRYGKKDTAPTGGTPSFGVPPLLAKPEESSATPPTTPVQTETKPPEKRDTSPDASASARHRARLRGRADAGKPTTVIPENMGEPTGPPSPATAIPVQTSLGTTWVDSSGYTYPWKPKAYDPEEYGFVSGSELVDMTGLPKAWSDLKSQANYAAEGFKSEYDKAQKESPDTPLRSAAKGAWEYLKRARPNTDWTKLQ